MDFRLKTLEVALFAMVFLICRMPQSGRASNMAKDIQDSNSYPVPDPRFLDG